MNELQADNASVSTVLLHSQVRFTSQQHVGVVNCHVTPRNPNGYALGRCRPDPPGPLLQVRSAWFRLDPVLLESRQAPVRPALATIPPTGLRKAPTKMHTP